MNRIKIGRRSFMRRTGAALAGLFAAASGFPLVRVFAQEKEFSEFVCLDAISKNMEGEIGVERAEEQKCEHPLLKEECVTLKTLDQLKMTVQGHDCDSDISRELLDGDFTATLVSSYIRDGNQRGYHSGEFEWFGRGARVAGHMAGITNAGTHREPLDGCEPCDIRGHMEGRLDGDIVEGELVGSRVTASYTVRFDPTEGGAAGGVTATLEGVLISPCGSGPDGSSGCITFDAFPNGIAITSNTILVGDEFLAQGVLLGGAPESSYCAGATSAAVRSDGAYGLPFNFLTTVEPPDINMCNGVPIDIQFPTPVRQVTLTFAGASVTYTLRAYDSGGALVGTATQAAVFGGGTFQVSFSSASANISRITFGYTTAITAIKEICYER